MIKFKYSFLYDLTGKGVPFHKESETLAERKHINIASLDISRIKMEVFDMSILRGFPMLEDLNLSHCKIDVIRSTYTEFDAPKKVI